LFDELREDNESLAKELRRLQEGNKKLKNKYDALK
jgi:chaperonin cofactor prefoldin